MDIAATKSNHDLLDSLDRLETSLLVPVVSGELPAWVSEVHAAWTNVANSVELQFARNHPRDYEQIAGEDPALLPQIEQLKAEDDAICKSLESLSPILTWLTEHAADFEPDESKLKQHVALLSKEGIALISRIKKQELTLQTWYVEAFNRDRGIAD